VTGDGFHCALSFAGRREKSKRRVQGSELSRYIVFKQERRIWKNLKGFPVQSSNWEL
jgi:hypothetical protein